MVVRFPCLSYVVGLPSLSFRESWGFFSIRSLSDRPDLMGVHSGKIVFKYSHDSSREDWQKGASLAPPRLEKPSFAHCISSSHNHYPPQCPTASRHCAGTETVYGPHPKPPKLRVTYSVSLESWFLPVFCYSNLRLTNILDSLAARCDLYDHVT